MPYPIENQVFGFKKESHRGIAEPAPDKFLAPGSEASFDYKSLLVPDSQLRGIKEPFPSSPGITEGSGTLPALDVEPQTIGDLLYGCLGGVESQQPDAANSPTVYIHTFRPKNTAKFPSFTFFVDRGISVKKYPLTVFKKLNITGSVNGKAQISADVLFKTEEPSSNFTPTYNTPKPLMFYQTEFKLNNILNQDVKSWFITIDNGSSAYRTLSQSREPKDIISSGKFSIEGGYEIYFETEDEREKFLNNLPQTINITLTGDVIEDAYKNKLEINIPKAKYTAYGFGTLEGLFGSAVKFNAEFAPASGFSIEFILTNSIPGY